ncbi:MAG: hypothetical protein R6W72_04725 [Desulfurivibrionaceae bacterium]
MFKDRTISWIMPFILIFLISVLSGCATIDKTTQKDEKDFEPGYSYDARLFLSNSEINLFNRLFQNFNENRLGKDWEWKDVDPLALFSPAENRKRRRELFLYEYSPNDLLLTEKKPTKDQLAFLSVLKNRFPKAQILMTSKTVKIISRYEPSYDDLPTLRKANLSIPPAKNILELTADLGLQWANSNGTSLYIYNESILMSKFKSGYVSLAFPNIDRPIEH